VDNVTKDSKALDSCEIARRPVRAAPATSRDLWLPGDQPRSNDLDAHPVVRNLWLVIGTS
jgi:hypothetical protein